METGLTITDLYYLAAAIAMVVSFSAGFTAGSAA